MVKQTGTEGGKLARLSRQGPTGKLQTLSGRGKRGDLTQQQEILQQEKNQIDTISQNLQLDKISSEADYERKYEQIPHGYKKYFPTPEKIASQFRQQRDAEGKIVSI